MHHIWLGRKKTSSYCLWATYFKRVFHSHYNVLFHSHFLGSSVAPHKEAESLWEGAVHQERFGEAGMMEKTVFLEKDISDGGASMMQTVPRESHECHLHGGHLVGGCRHTWNQPEQQREKNLSTQPTSDQLVTFLLPEVLVLPRGKGHLKPCLLPLLPHSHLEGRTLSRVPCAIWHVLISYLFYA